jgi:hypothetical protein
MLARVRRRGLLARGQAPKEFLFEFERGLEARAYELNLHITIKLCGGIDAWLLVFPSLSR